MRCQQDRTGKRPGGRVSRSADYLPASLAVTILHHSFLLATFAAVPPLWLIGRRATRVANFLADRRARHLQRPRPRLNYLFMALGCAAVGVAFALLARAAGAWSPEPASGTGWMAQGLVWAMTITACATLMMVGRALTVVPVRQPAWVVRLRNFWQAHSYSDEESK
jgi:polyferredoxin